jgi:hypothetical protein
MNMTLLLDVNSTAAQGIQNKFLYNLASKSGLILYRL